MRLLVFGSGVSGKAAARLAARLGHTVTVFDERLVDPSALLDMGVGLVSGAWDRELLNGVDLVVTSPGFSERSLPIVDTMEYGIPIWSEIEFAWRQLENVRVIGITGTNGKTTVTRLTTEMLVESGVSAQSAGNIGTALSDVVGTQADVLVVELSSFQLRFIDRFHPVAAAILNVAADHLDWHGSAAAYAAAKARIYERQDSEDLLVYNADDEGAVTASRHAASLLHAVSVTGRPEDGSGVVDGVLHVGDWSIPVAELGSTDPAYVSDLAVAAVLAFDQGAQPDAVATIMRRFVPSAHRRTHVASIGGVDYINDSKATNPHAALAAIAAYPSVILIAGGLAKGLDLSPLPASPQVRAVIAMGESAPTLLTAAGDKGRRAETMEQAVAMAASLARDGDTVLLAPGAASFDQFDSYGHRGDVFAAAVLALAEETT